ncbi:hypothetical protein OIU77_027999 [Salix suchowensis]|uniref:Uncharacterized protein n=1 Tax=Salix suchowensis TaxID=1278906 RepID=A0ABQ9BRK5_9ROSI|nr:hypothetical protein OIU77_027999 [Salix suchowensis]
MAEDDTHPPMSYQLHTSELESPHTAGHASSRYRLGSFRSGPHLGRVSGPHGLFPDDVAGNLERILSTPSCRRSHLHHPGWVKTVLQSGHGSCSTFLTPKRIFSWRKLSSLMTRKRRSSSPAPLREPSPALFPSSSRGTESESRAPAMFLLVSWGWRKVLAMDFAGAGSAGERSEKPVDLDLEAPKILILE